MKKEFRSMAVVSLCLALPAWSSSAAQERTVDWKSISKNLVLALASENEGLRQSAMEFFVLYSDRLDLNAAVYDVMRVYRNHKNMRVRKLALVTLYKMQNKWAMEFLKIDLRFQESEELKHMVAAIVREYGARKKAS